MSTVESPTVTHTLLPTGTWKIDPVHSSVEFQVKHLGIATVKGQFKEFEGTLEVGPDGARAYGTVNVASVDTREPQRDAHLRSPDFFDAEQYPEITFSSTTIHPLEEDTFEIEGELDDPRRHAAPHAERHARGHRDRPPRQPSRRSLRERPDQPLGLRHEVQHGARIGQRRRQRQGQDPARHLGRQGRLTRCSAGSRRSPRRDPARPPEAVTIRTRKPHGRASAHEDVPGASAHEDVAERLVDRAERVRA